LSQGLVVLIVGVAISFLGFLIAAINMTSGGMSERSFDRTFRRHGVAMAVMALGGTVSFIGFLLWLPDLIKLIRTIFH